MKKYTFVFFAMVGFLNCSHQVNTHCLTESIEKDLISGKPVLQVGKTTIYQGQIDALSEIMPGFRANWNSPEDRKQMVAQLIEQELFFQKAQQENLLSNNKRLQENLWMQIRNYQAGTYLLQEVDKRAHQQYELDKDKLYSQIEIKDIVYFYKNTGVDQPDQQQKIALQKAQALRKKLNSKNFSELAAQETDNPIAKADGGKIGTISLIDQRIRFMGWKELIDTAFKLGKNKVSDPIVTTEGVHIIQPIGDKQTQSFEDVQAFLRTSLEAEVKKEVLEKMIKETKIEYLDPSLKP
jgi:hypothetical protein